MGPYSNSTESFSADPAYEKGHWYLNSTGALIIVPDATAEIEGSDDAAIDVLNCIYRATPFDQVNAEQVATLMNLVVVSDVLKRFDTSIGYYST